MATNRQPITTEEFAYYQAKGAQERAGGNEWEAGPITAVTTDDEINKRAGKLAHRHGAPLAIVVALLNLERRVAQLESKANPPGYPKFERR